MKDIRSILIEALGIENENEEKQNQMVEAFGAIIYQAVITRAMEEMKDDLLDEFEKLTDGEPTPDMLVGFFLEKIPNFESMIAEEATRIIANNQNIMGQIG